jgi:hypothetical protein
MSYYAVGTDVLLKVFAEEIASHSGHVADKYDDGERLFARSILPLTDEVAARDQVQAGVALKATAEKISVYPYVFREVCRNGSIMACSLAARQIVRSAEQSPEEEIEFVRQAIEVCCGDDVFRDSVVRMKSMRREKGDLSLALLPSISRLRGILPSVVGAIIEQFFRESDQSQFGLMNAITAVARESHDPDERWNLEELGGSVVARISPTPPGDPLVGRAVHCELNRELATVE